MSGRSARGCAALVLAIATTTAVHAQGQPLAERLRGLLRQGDSARVRSIADSVQRAPAPAPGDRAEAAYWRAVAAAPDSARRALLTYIVEYPLAPRTEDALATLGDAARDAGDRSNARHFYAQLLADNLASDVGARAMQSYAQLLASEGKASEACTALDRAQGVVAASSVELAAQLSYARRGCAVTPEVAPAHADSASPPAASSTTVPPKPTVATPKPASRAPGKATPSHQWSVQVAAFADRSDALRLAGRLTARNLDARVTTDAPYRVRIGRYGQRDAAQALAKKLTAEKTTAIVVEAERP